MKTKGDWVNLEYEISTRKEKETDLMSKSSKKTLKQVNIRWKKGDWVNLEYKISTSKKKATDWISKSSKKNS